MPRATARAVDGRLRSARSGSVGQPVLHRRKPSPVPTTLLTLQLKASGPRTSAAVGPSGERVGRPIGADPGRSLLRPTTRPPGAGARPRRRGDRSVSVLGHRRRRVGIDRTRPSTSGCVASGYPGLMDPALGMVVPLVSTLNAGVLRQRQGVDQGTTGGECRRTRGILGLPCRPAAEGFQMLSESLDDLPPDRRLRRATAWVDGSGLLAQSATFGGGETVLRGRQQEQGVLDALLRDVRAGRSRVLVLRGEAGVGKTALLDHLAQRARLTQLHRATGVETESEVAYSALQQLCGPLLDPYLERLPQPQREALSTAFGLRPGPPPEALVVGLAVLGLFAQAARSKPLGLHRRRCPVAGPHVQRPADLRRAAAAGGIGRPVFSIRDDVEHELDGLPELRVRGIAPTDARLLLDTVLHGPVDDRVRDQLVAETGGNPLALLELPRAFTLSELSFGFGSQASESLMGRLEEGFYRRVSALPPDTRQLLVTAAVEPLGDVTLLWRALEQQEIAQEAVVAAEAAGLVQISTRVRFRHPWSGRRAGGRSASSNVVRPTRPSPARPIPSGTQTGAPGTAATPRWGQMLRWRLSWKRRPIGPSAGEAGPPAQRSWPAPPS